MGRFVWVIRVICWFSVRLGVAKSPHHLETKALQHHPPREEAAAQGSQETGHSGAQAIAIDRPTSWPWPGIKQVRLEVGEVAPSLLGGSNPQAEVDSAL